MKTLHISYDGRVFAAWWDGNTPTQSIKNKRVIIAMNIPDFYLDRCHGSQKEVVQYLQNMNIIPNIPFQTKSLPTEYAAKGIELAVKKKMVPRFNMSTTGDLFSEEK